MHNPYFDENIIKHFSDIEDISAMIVYTQSMTPVNDTNASIRVIDHWSMTRMHASVSLTKSIRVIDQWSMTWMHTFVSMTMVNDTNACLNVIDQNHLRH